ncbi:hypothetical protein [Faecalibaculum rodentium]|uniref:hypothetical protein n=1 Tax=Faecalibaculum rodentium TaxID=1702221 RepID=UPI0023F537DC|nr:hypothetical protein [Faecalibaculum rodentium]
MIDYVDISDDSSMADIPAAECDSIRFLLFFVETGCRRVLTDSVYSPEFHERI